MTVVPVSVLLSYNDCTVVPVSVLLSYNDCSSSLSTVEL